MTRYERVLAVAEAIDKAVPAKSKARAEFVTQFDARKICWIQWQVDLDHEEEMYGDEFELRWRFTKPDGTTDDEQIVVSSVGNTWGESYHFVTCGPLEWPPGKYTLRVSLWDEPFAEATMFVDEPGGAL